MVFVVCVQPKAIVDVDRLKKKIMLSGFVGKAATEGLMLTGSFQRDESERAAAMQKKKTNEPEVSGRNKSYMNLLVDLHEVEDDVTAQVSPIVPLTELAPNRERKTMVRGTIMKLASGGSHGGSPLAVVGAHLVATTPAERVAAAASATAQSGASSPCPSPAALLAPSVESRPPPFRPNFLGGLLGGAGGLRKVQRPEEKDEATKEAEAAARKAKEKSEQLRLWPELQKIAVKEKNEIAFEDVQILQEIGRGKFASVHTADMKMQLHQKVFGTKEAAKRTFERLGNNLNKRAGDSSQMVLAAAVKVLEYSNAYPLVGGDWERDKPAEPEYMDDTTYTDGENGDRYQETRSRSNTSDADSLRGCSYADRYEIYPPSKCLLEALREVRALVHLHHSNIVILHGLVMKPRLMLVMERMQCSLHDALSTPPEQLQVPLTPAQRIHILSGVADGLAHMHSMRFIHRDLKVSSVSHTTSTTLHIVFGSLVLFNCTLLLRCTISCSAPVWEASWPSWLISAPPCPCPPASC
jgi:hypothetical protein